MIPDSFVLKVASELKTPWPATVEAAIFTLYIVNGLSDDIIIDVAFDETFCSSNGIPSVVTEIVYPVMSPFCSQGRGGCQDMVKLKAEIDVTVKAGAAKGTVGENRPVNNSEWWY